MKTADKITTSRLILAPIFFLVFFLPYWTRFSPALSVCIMLPLLGIAELTDFFDGYYARKSRQVSDFGKLYDPFGDVMLHLTVFICLVKSGYMPPFVFVLIMYREFSMNFVRLMAMQKGVVIAARKGGKLKTVLYVMSAFYTLVLISCQRLGFTVPEMPFKIVAWVLYGICVAAAYSSFIDYLIHFRSVLVGKTDTGGK
jgi:CDP-diacylglycerol--glycerol-3-phosphate 3-phosphatidyltransferase